MRFFKQKSFYFSAIRFLYCSTYAEFAGVIFTADAITGSDDFMVGNYVRGEGEKLVSGSENARVFTIKNIHFSYEGPKEFAVYSKTLWKYSKEIKRLYGREST